MDIIALNEASTANSRIEKFIENPDSTSGVLTQPKVIEAGETVTIKSGRQAILADTVVNGDLVIEAGGAVFVPAGAGFSDLDQRIDTKLDKDFSSFINKLTPISTDNFVLQEVGGDSRKLSFANLMAWVKSFSFGWGQAWQNVAANRSSGVTYTNTTGKPIQVICGDSINSGGSLTWQIDDVSWNATTNSNAVGVTSTMCFTVLNGSTYKYTGIISVWNELR